MPDERYTYEQARVRLEEIVGEVRKKDTSLEKSLDLLEEGVRLANICTELVDHTDLSDSRGAGSADAGAPEGDAARAAAGDGDASTVRPDDGAEADGAEDDEAVEDAGSGDD